MTKIINGRDFQNADIDEQIRLIFQQPLPERAELIALSRNPRKIVSALSSEELLFITNSTDREGVMELASYASTDQLVFLTDYNCWNDDSVNHEHFVQWLSDLLEIGLEKFTATIRNLDYEMLVSALKHCIEIIKTEHEEVIDEIVGDDPYFTLDNLYYVRVMNEDNFRTVKTALEVVYAKDKELYFELLEGIISETDSQVEEEAFELREERLAEHGFPPKEESFRIYTPLGRDDFAGRETKDLALETGVKPGAKTAAGGSGEAAAAHAFPAVWGGGRGVMLFDEALAAMAESGSPREHVEHVSKELIWIINKTIVCNGGKISPEIIKTSATQARAYTSLGLDVLSGGNRQTCARLVSEHWLEDIFRVGFSAADAARKRLIACIREYWRADLAALIAFLGTAMGGDIELFCRHEPLISGGDGNEPRPVSSLADVAAIDQYTGWMNILFRALIKNGLADWHDVFSREDLKLNMESEVFTLSTLICTALINYDTKGKMSLEPVKAETLRRFLASHAGQDGRPEMAIHTLDSFTSLLLADARETATVETVVNIVHSVIRLMQEEFSGFDAEDTQIDPKYIDMVLMEA